MSPLRSTLASFCTCALLLFLCGCTAVPGVTPAQPQVPIPLNHIVFLAQENRSFDHYFGQMRQYWAQNGYPDQSSDGCPQFNPSTGAPPLPGPAPALPGCDPASPFPTGDCVADP